MASKNSYFKSYMRGVASSVGYRKKIRISDDITAQAWLDTGNAIVNAMSELAEQNRDLKKSSIGLMNARRYSEHTI